MLMRFHLFALFFINKKHTKNYCIFNERRLIKSPPEIIKNFAISQNWKKKITQKFMREISRQKFVEPKWKFFLLLCIIKSFFFVSREKLYDIFNDNFTISMFSRHKMWPKYLEAKYIYPSYLIIFCLILVVDMQYLHFD